VATAASVGRHGRPQKKGKLGAGLRCRKTMFCDVSGPEGHTHATASPRRSSRVRHPLTRLLVAVLSQNAHSATSADYGRLAVSTRWLFCCGLWLGFSCCKTLGSAAEETKPVRGLETARVQNKKPKGCGSLASLARRHRVKSELKTELRRNLPSTPQSNERCGSG
jgi:hypothetical protein